jgi:hypothetical protein
VGETITVKIKKKNIPQGIRRRWICKIVKYGYVFSVENKTDFNFLKDLRIGIIFEYPINFHKVCSHIKDPPAVYVGETINIPITPSGNWRRHKLA